MTEFKVGDWVRLKPNQNELELEKSKLYKVNRIDNSIHGLLLYVHPHDCYYGLYAERFELVRSAEEGFKVGDVIDYNSNYDSGNWKNVTITDVKRPDYAKGHGKDGVLGGFCFKDIVLVSVAEEKKIGSSDGLLEIGVDETGSWKFIMKGDKFVVDDSKESHELTAREAKKIVEDAIVSLSDVIDVYEALIANGFVIKKVG